MHLTQGLAVQLSWQDHACEATQTGALRKRFFGYYEYSCFGCNLRQASGRDRLAFP
jgi:hypothetical protein